MRQYVKNYFYQESCYITLFIDTKIVKQSIFKSSNCRQTSLIGIVTNDKSVLNR